MNFATKMNLDFLFFAIFALVESPSFLHFAFEKEKDFPFKNPNPTLLKKLGKSDGARFARFLVDVVYC